MNEYGQWIAVPVDTDHQSIQRHMQDAARESLEKEGLRPVGEIHTWYFLADDELSRRDIGVDGPVMVHCWKAMAE